MGFPTNAVMLYLDVLQDNSPHYEWWQCFAGALCAYEAIPLQSAFFAKLWCEIYQAEKSDKNYIKLLCNSTYLIDYMETILHDDRISLNLPHVYQFFCFFFPLVSSNCLSNCPDTPVIPGSDNYVWSSKLDALAPMRYLYFHSFLTYSVKQRAVCFSACIDDLICKEIYGRGHEVPRFQWPLYRLRKLV